MKVSIERLEEAEVILKRLSSIETTVVTGLNEASNTTTESIGGNCTQIHAGEHIGFTWNLFRSSDQKVQVNRTFLPKGAFIDFHNHEAIEKLVVWEGAMKITLQDTRKEILVGAGEDISLPKGEFHAARVVENCWFVVISIPAVNMDNLDIC
jgi:quercetin dioxygenase-like cupin family protein